MKEVRWVKEVDDCRAASQLWPFSSKAERVSVEAVWESQVSASAPLSSSLTTRRPSFEVSS